MKTKFKNKNNFFSLMSSLLILGIVVINSYNISNIALNSVNYDEAETYNEKIYNGFQYYGIEEIVYSGSPNVGDSPNSPKIVITETIVIQKLDDELKWSDFDGFTFNLTGNDVNYLFNTNPFGSAQDAVQVETIITWGEEVKLKQWWTSKEGDVPFEVREKAAEEGGSWNIVVNSLPPDVDNPLYNEYISFVDLTTSNIYFKQAFEYSEAEDAYYLHYVYEININSSKEEATYHNWEFYNWINLSFQEFGNCQAWNCANANNGGGGSVLNYEIKLVNDNTNYSMKQYNGETQKDPSVAINYQVSNNAIQYFIEVSSVTNTSNWNVSLYNENDVLIESNNISYSEMIDGKYNDQFTNITLNSKYKIIVSFDFNNNAFSKKISFEKNVFSTEQTPNVEITNENIDENTISFIVKSNNKNLFSNWKVSIWNSSMQKIQEVDILWSTNDESNKIVFDNLKSGEYLVKITCTNMLNQEFSFEKTFETNPITLTEIFVLPSNDMNYKFISNKSIVAHYDVPKYYDNQVFLMQYRIIYSDEPEKPTSWIPFTISYGKTEVNINVDTKRVFKIEINFFNKTKNSLISEEITITGSEIALNDDFINEPLFISTLIIFSVTIAISIYWLILKKRKNKNKEIID